MVPKGRQENYYLLVQDSRLVMVYNKVIYRWYTGKSKCSRNIWCICKSADESLRYNQKAREKRSPAFSCY